jgi:hypothetical protein
VPHELTPPVVATLSNLCCIAKNPLKVWKCAGCSGQFAKIKFHSTKWDNCPAKHQRCHTSFNWVFNRGADMIFSDGQHQLSFVVQIPVAAEGERGLDVGRHFGEIHFAVVGLEDFLNPRAGGVNALVLLPETPQGLEVLKCNEYVVRLHAPPVCAGKQTASMFGKAEILKAESRNRKAEGGN